MAWWGRIRRSERSRFLAPSSVAVQRAWCQDHELMTAAATSPLTNHTIASIERLHVSARYPRMIGRNAVLGSHGPGATCRAVILRTTEGAAGWGLVRGELPISGDVLGKRLDQLIDPAIGIIDDSAAWADLALHDLAGVVLSEPVYRMLGARGTWPVPVYDGSIYFDDLDPEGEPRGIDAVLQNVGDGWSAGYRAFKLKIGRGCTWMPAREGLARDVAVTRAVRDAFPTASLLVDGNNGFTIDSLLQYLEQVEDMELFWVEEPFHENQPDLERLREWLTKHNPQTLIADGEYRPNVDEVVHYAREGLVDVLLMDVISYGMTPWRRLYPSLEAFGGSTSPHAWGHPLKTIYAAHVAAGLPGVILVEGVPGVMVGVDMSGYTLHNGLLTLPDTPGFGIPLPA